jgi:dTDP-D-glucose 4,6-dehydratase
MARENLRWQPKVTLEDGLKETVEYFKQVLGVSARSSVSYTSNLVKLNC